MLTGRRLFAGETLSHTLADVPRAHRPQCAAQDGAPAVRTLIGRCLERDAKKLLREISAKPASCWRIRPRRRSKARRAGRPCSPRSPPRCCAPSPPYWHSFVFGKRSPKRPSSRPAARRGDALHRRVLSLMGQQATLAAPSASPSWPAYEISRVIRAPRPLMRRCLRIRAERTGTVHLSIAHA
jgi:hypothetical protein